MKRSVERAVGFVGAGNMAAALVNGLLSAKLFRPRDLWVADPVAKRRGELKRRFGVVSATDNRELVSGSRTVILAVKPQVMLQVLQEIREAVTPRKLFVSIAAGFPLDRLQERLGADARIVRVMPNTPALLGKGMSVLVPGRYARSGDARFVLRMLRAVGDAIVVRDERLLDPVTGLSGSGPAYVYLFAESLIDGGVREGLDPDIARRLTFETLAGACAMLQQTGLSPRALREMVTSPGGTTLAGLTSLEKGRFSDIVAGAVAAATSRSRELRAKA